MKPASFSIGLIRLTQTQRGDASGQLTSQWPPMKSTSLPFPFPCPPCSREGLARSHAQSLARFLCDQGPPCRPSGPIRSCPYYLEKASTSSLSASSLSPDSSTNQMTVDLPDCFSEACPGPAGLSRNLITKHLLSTSCLAVVP